jgi:DNA primase
MHQIGDFDPVTVTDDIKARLDIVDVVSAHVALQRSGRGYKGLCPFHSEKTPSFHVFPERQSWRCFGACATGGDLFNFIMRAEHLEFSEALRRLAERAGVVLPSRQERNQRSQSQQVNEEASAYFTRLLGSAQGTDAKAYLEGRGVSPTAISTFEFGLSPEDGHSLGDYLSAKGFEPELVATSGLTNRGENGTYRDLFRGRLMFPIHSRDGSLVGFGARALDDSIPKYLNSPQSPSFNKSHILYGLHMATDAITSSGTVVVVEGYMDVIAAHEHGFKNVVASMGTALTGEQAGMLRSMASSIVVALDPDAAGQEATLRGLEAAWGVFHHEQVRSGRNVTLYQRPQRPELKIAPLPPGRDPDQLIRHDSQAWAELVEGALPLMDYLFQALPMRFDTATPEGKGQLRDTLFPLIAAIEEPFLQDNYFQGLAQLLGVTSENLRANLARTPLRNAARNSNQRERRPERGREASNSSPITPLDRDPVEDYCLTLLLQEPDLESMAASLRLEHFTRPENREVMAYWSEGYDPELMDEDLRPNWDRLISHALPPTDRRQREEALMDSVARLEARYLRKLKMEEELRLSEASPEELESQYEDVLQRNERMKELLAEKVR